MLPTINKNNSHTKSHYIISHHFINDVILLMGIPNVMKHPYIMVMLKMNVLQSRAPSLISYAKYTLSLRLQMSS